MSIVAAYAVPHPPLIIPAVGRGDERAIQDTIDAFQRVAQEIIALQPDLLVITSPHAPCFSDAFHVTTDEVLHGSMARFRAPQEQLDAMCDTDFAYDVLRRLNEADIFAVGSDRYRDDMDHATYVALYFIREAYQAAGGKGDLPCPIVRIGLSGLSYETHRQVGHVIAQAVQENGKQVVFVGSGDLSHKLKPEGPYGFAPEGPVFDAKIGEIFESGNLEELFTFKESFADAAAECGLRSFQIMAAAIDGCGFTSELLSLEGPFGVGYGVAALRSAQ